jgi:hypothetical protein
LQRGAALNPAELAGLAAGSKPAALTLEQAYSLALIRTHNPSGTLAAFRSDQLDPVALDQEARRAGALDFDQPFEQIINPPGGGTSPLAQSANVATQTFGVLQAQSRLYRGRAQLVAQWLDFKQPCLELYRELGSMPYGNWDAFHRSFLRD